MPLDAVSVLIGFIIGFAVGFLAASVIIRRGLTAIQENESYSYTCGVCGRAFPTRTEGRDHLRDVHDAPGGREDINKLLDNP